MYLSFTIELAQGKEKIPLNLTVSILRQIVNVHNVMCEKNNIHTFLLYFSAVELNTKYMKRQILCNQSDKYRLNNSQMEVYFCSWMNTKHLNQVLKYYINE